MKWDIRFCALELDPASYDFRLNYYHNQEQWQARMPPKGSIGVGLAQVTHYLQSAFMNETSLTISAASRAGSTLSALLTTLMHELPGDTP